MSLWEGNRFVNIPEIITSLTGKVNSGGCIDSYFQSGITSGAVIFFYPPVSTGIFLLVTYKCRK
jgi:hypothetical protein